MKELEKIKVRIKDVPYVYLETNILSGELETVSKNILNIKDKLKEAFLQREINVADYKIPPVFTPFEDYKYIHINIVDYDGLDIEIEVFRDETEEEFKKREELQKLRSIVAKKGAESKKLAQEKREKTLLATLKKKYE